MQSIRIWISRDINIIHIAIFSTIRTYQCKSHFKGTGKKMPWQRGKEFECITKYELASNMLEWALEMGFPKAIVLADS